MFTRTTTRLFVLAACMLLPAVAQAQGPARAISPLAARTSDAAIARDSAIMNGLQQQLYAARRDKPALPQYPFEKAQRWLSLAREAYEGNSPGSIANDAFVESQRLVAELEAGRVPPLLQGTKPPAYAAPVRPDLQKLADYLRASPDLDKVAAEAAALEMSLIRSALAQAKLLLCTGENPERAAEREGMRAVSIINRLPPVVAVTPRTDTVFVERAVAPRPSAPAAVANVPTLLTGVPPNVHFGLNLDALSAASRAVLGVAADSLLRYAGVNITLSGNTDSRGNVAYNQALSRRRAAAVQAYLVGRGIEPARITIQALGQSNLRVKETGTVDLARNRRVDITYVSPEGRVIETKEGLDDLQVEGVGATRAPKAKAAAKKGAKTPAKAASGAGAKP